MKIPPLLPIIAAACTLAAPVSAHADDHKRDHGRDNHDRDDHRRGPVFVHGYSRGYRYGYGPYYRYPYWRPGIGFYFYDGPYGVYRGQPVDDGYSDDLGADVQRALRNRGYYRGPIDGDIGPESRAAIRAYQSDRGLAATGRIDTPLLHSLHID